MVGEGGGGGQYETERWGKRERREMDGEREREKRDEGERDRMKEGERPERASAVFEHHTYDHRIHGPNCD